MQEIIAWKLWILTIFWQCKSLNEILWRLIFCNLCQKMWLASNCKSWHTCPRQCNCGQMLQQHFSIHIDQFSALRWLSRYHRALASTSTEEIAQTIRKSLEKRARRLSFPTKWNRTNLLHATLFEKLCVYFFSKLDNSNFWCLTQPDKNTWAKLATQWCSSWF